MKNIHVLIIVALLISACGEERPAPDVFLDYGSPFYENINGQVLHKLDEEIKLGSFGRIHSLIIIRNDRIVFENYYNNYGREDLEPLGAATQCMVSTLTGTVLHQDQNLSLTDKIIDLFPEYSAYFDNIPQKDQIEIRHLMTHTSGLWWDEWTHPFGNQNNDAYIMTQSEDWIDLILSTPMIREPGREFNFNSGNAVLMAPILQKTTGTEMEELMYNNLFKPLGISEWKWERIPGGYINAAWGLHLKPIDIAKVGYLFLKEGIWNDQQLFGENWRTISSRRRYNITGYYGYGYFWWTFSSAADVVRFLRTNDVFFTWGEGGQFMFVVPHLDLLVVTTADNDRITEIKAIEMMRDYIFNSIQDRFAP